MLKRTWSTSNICKTHIYRAEASFRYHAACLEHLVRGLDRMPCSEARSWTGRDGLSYVFTVVLYTHAPRNMLHVSDRGFNGKMEGAPHLERRGSGCTPSKVKALAQSHTPHPSHLAGSASGTVALYRSAYDLSLIHI